MASAGVFAAAVYLRGGRVFVLVRAFVVNDFTVAYVARQLELHAAAGVVPGVAACTGAHEARCCCGCCFDERLDHSGGGVRRQVPADIVARVLAVMGMVCAGFLAFILFTSTAVRPHAAAFSGGGARPEPAAAGPGADFHPPLLCMGYVGFSAFAFAIAALLSGRLDNAFADFAARGRWRRGCS